ncbi:MULTISPECIES: hypothetical protein [unclassified Haloferax]|uniref:phage NrS-1 polymerase family protein n=1 Tax=unclassified Haloferax TaxID=2625095 RepID=UPI002873FDCF|nr:MULTISPECIES: hypothetical protein [unclassified Haloferax]MDS0243750.1 hypothetical protein [Haloferax sp. S2CR25]MDS0446871.1 hypothetical protein [Haloferax sp. S2CR25-2]
MTKETTTFVTQETPPPELVERDQWVCWRSEKRDGKKTKIPVFPGDGSFASSTDPDTWSDFETARSFVEANRADGIGFVFTAEDPIVGVDLDDCRDPETGDTDEDAQDIIDRLDSYTEISPSGTGYHVLIKGDLPDGRNRRGNIELYDTARFFTVTGDRVDDTSGHVKRRQDALEAIHREYVQLHSENKDPERDEHTSVRDDAKTTPQVDLEDDELLKKAKNASNGAKFERLWNGNTAGYDSNSEADMALCCLLAFWTGGDTAQMDTLFRQSGLLRAKWDEVHYADGSTYGEKTIERATEATSDYYDPSPRNESTQSKLETTDVDTDEPNRQNAYLLEKNQLLSTRVSELEVTIEQKNERIEALERQVEDLSAEPSGQSDEDGRGQGQRTGGTEDKSDKTSLLGRTRRLLSGNSE